MVFEQAARVFTRGTVIREALLRLGVSGAVPRGPAPVTDTTVANFQCR